MRMIKKMKHYIVPIEGKKYYEDRRQQDRVELANGLRSLFSQLQQQIPHTSFDLGVFGSLLLDDHSEKDANFQDNMEGMLPLQSASTSNQGVNHMTDEQEEEVIEDEDEDLI
ncbi:uncharacterized protein LOC110723484 [Chenopodium quinoa]|uniref:uncharacterized protein LOC110723484 n=1 Tax=Chenopodium quinoa TaxID=63459 RepID=UPI000B798568|nr:uncharacterized protein LOC110723484 [Chenopodium quinoa]